MHIFRINEEIEIACEWKKTRTAFKHEAALLTNGSEEERVKICYLNRTWEQYEFQSVIHKLLEKSRILTEAQKVPIRAYLDGADGYSGAGVKRDMEPLHFIGALAALGDVFAQGDAKAANDFKARILKAGLSSYGLEMPDDWGNLSEEDKGARLDAVVSRLTK